MRRLGFILLTGICLLVFVVPIRSQEIPDFITDSLTMDSIAIDSLDPDPEWYVEPLVREADFAPRRAAAANCPVDSVLTFNVDSILSEVTVYEYGDTTRTMVWTVNTDGSRIGKSRTESASTATTSYSATYAWDASSNNWKGTSKEEHTYNSANKETLRVLYNTWLNNDWLADTKYTWVYDASNREHEYTTYTRNTSTNQLVLSKQRIREYNAAGKTTLDIQYTAHNGTTWSAGTKKIYDFDASGNQIEYTYYSSLSNGNWVGSTHEVWVYTGGKKTYYEKQTWSNGDWSNSSKEIWAYNGPSAKQTLYEKYTGSGSTWTGSSKEIWEYTTSGKQTLHEKYSWSNNDWSLTLQENLDYDAAGNNTLVENYNVSSGVFSGSKKEEYTYNSANKKTGTFTYKWTNGAWVYNQWTVTGYDAAGNTIESCKYNWSNDAWVGSGTRTLQTFNSSKKVTEKITQSWPTNATDWINKTCTTTVYSGANVTQEAYYTWQDDAWLGTKRSDYHYNAKNQNDTIKTYTNNGTDWIYSNRTVKTFNAAGTNIMTHNAKWENNAWVMTSMTRTDIIMDGQYQLLKAAWHCGNDSVWIGDQKDTTYYSSTYQPIFTARYTSWANSDWVPSYKVDYEYDDEDRTILTQRYNWSDNQWKGYYRYEYEYNAQGQQTSSAYYSGWNASTSTWVGSSKITTVYSETGKTSSLQTYEWKNNAWLPKNNTIFEYDEAGNTVEQIAQIYTNNTWVNTIRYEKVYIGSTLVISNDYTWLNDIWQITRRSEKTYDEDVQAKLRREITGLWNSTTGILQSFTDKYYAYACDPHYYTIRFVNYDGTELSSESIIEGETPSYNGEEPTKQEDAEFTYSFAGWTPSVVPVTGNATYTATYTATKRTYTITWLNEDGSQLGQETLEYGATPSHVDMNKENTAEYTYTFIGWTPGIGIVTGDATYTATFDTTKNTYTVTWLNEDGSELSHETLEYGANPQHADLTKDATAEYTYTFTGWTPQIATVTGNATYQATFSATKRSYTITWLNADGSELSHETLEYGATPTHADAIQQNTAEYTYTFTGWTPQIATVTGDATYRAQFNATKNSYTVTWKNENGSEIYHETVEYGVTPSYTGTEPTKAADEQYTYAFNGWTPQIEMVTGDIAYQATFVPIKNNYTILFLNEDGTELQRTEENYGVTPVYNGATPTKTATAEYTYTFSGWDKTIAAVTEDATYTATYSSTKNTYTVTWLNDDNTQIDQTTVEYGEMPTHVDPTKAATAEFNYTFAGWTPTITTVTGDASYTATYTATKRSYTITWLNEDGSEIEHETLEYGAIPQHTDATKENTAEFTYTFIGWTPQIATVTGDATYTAQFNATKNSYTVTWLNEDGSEIEHETLEYGATPSHVDPTKESTAEYTYAFAGWTPQIVTVTGDASYTASFTATKNKYTIIFLNYDGTELQSSEVEYGIIPNYEGATPIKPADAQDTYTFAGWDQEIIPVAGTKTYTATFTGTKNSYTITWLNDDNTLIDQITVEYGAMPQHEAATKENTAEFTYTFTGWTPGVGIVTGDATYQATFTQTKNSYTITWLNEDGSEIEHETLEYGATPSHVDPTKEATDEFTYTFAGWNPAVTSVTGDASYTATFSAIKNKYTITFKNEDGSDLQISEVEYGTTPTYNGVEPGKAATAQYTYTFAGWDKTVVPVVGEATYQATFTQTKNSYTITWLNEDGSEIEHETLEYGATPAHADMTKENTAEFTYTFTGWTPGIGIVTGDAEYTATFSATKNSYTITWINEDGSEIEHETLEYGATPAHADVTKENTAEFTYTFTGWTPAIVSITGDASYNATFSATKNKYTITWLDDDNTQIDQTSVEYGVVPTHDDPAKQATAEFTYTFAGWDNEPIAVVGEATYKATYTSAKNSYTITWLDEDDSSLGTSTVEYGVVPTHEDPTKQPTAQYGYTFAGWSPAISAVTGNATYKATYTDTINQYTISWLDDTGTLVDQTKVAYGATPAHANIYKESDSQYDYTFVGWTPTLVPVTGDASYSAIFTTAGKSYTVTFYFEDGVTVLDQMTLPYGAIPSTPYIPSIPSDANHTYTFSGWSPEIAPVTGDISYVPTFTAIPNQYTVIFRNYNGKELQRKKVDYGTIPEYEGDEPSRPATNSYTWAFEGWTPELTAVVGDATYTAVYSKVMNTYTILFYDEDGSTLLDEVTVEHGQKPTTSVIPTKEADEEYTYTFAGWSPKIAKATSDAEYTATYLATPKTQDLNNTEAEGAAIKVIIEDNIYIRRGGNTYSIDGQRVK